ncbi:MAG: phosphoenolpyruvate mutase [Halobacteriovoraceae bacterium]|nr:phosphoenolpyruvate mutase [Halobacteriovoraceae bacterium]
MQLPENRRPLLKQALQRGDFIRAIEAHNGLSAGIIESLKNQDSHFNAIWISSLTESVSRGFCDNEYLNLPSRFQTINEVMGNTSLPLIYDADSGSYAEHLTRTVIDLERLGVSAIVIEDKQGFKVNSLTEKDDLQKQLDPHEFSEKIKIAQKAKSTSDFLVIARIETFPLGGKLEDALLRAKMYAKAGADIIMIHSKESEFTQVREFATQYKESKPLMIVPSTYFNYTEEMAKEDGVQMVIYANQLLRSAYQAMSGCAQEILSEGHAKSIQSKLASVKDILNLKA